MEDNAVGHATQSKKKRKVRGCSQPPSKKKSICKIRPPKVNIPNFEGDLEFKLSKVERKMSLLENVENRERKEPKA